MAGQRRVTTARRIPSQVAKALKGRGESAAAQVAALAAELLAAVATRGAAPDGLELSPDGLAVRIAAFAADASARAARLNVGFVELGLGPAEAALEAVTRDGPPRPARVACVRVPADSSCAPPSSRFSYSTPCLLRARALPGARTGHHSVDTASNASSSEDVQ
jgi:hypothetical protein